MSLEKLEKELERLKSLRDQNHWETTRNPVNFEKRRIDTPLGVRTAWIPKDDLHNKDLQSSRSVSMRDVETIEDLEAGYEVGMTLTHTDYLRAEEIDECVHTWNKFKDQIGLDEFIPLGMCEIGFRYPRLIEFYSKKYKINTAGYDISTLAVEFGKSKNYNVHECDLNNLDTKPIELKDSNIVCMYHVLEHVKNPISTLKYLFDLMSSKTFFHIEVPIEGENPQVEFGHLFGFHPGDLAKMCQAVGFTVFSVVQKNIAGAIQIERVGCIKK